MGVETLRSSVTLKLSVTFRSTTRVRTWSRVAGPGLSVYAAGLWVQGFEVGVLGRGAGVQTLRLRVVQGLKVGVLQGSWVGVFQGRWVGV